MEKKKEENLNIVTPEALGDDSLFIAHTPDTIVERNDVQKVNPDDDSLVLDFEGEEMNIRRLFIHLLVRSLDNFMILFCN